MRGVNENNEAYNVSIAIVIGIRSTRELDLIHEVPRVENATHHQEPTFE